MTTLNTAWIPISCENGWQRSGDRGPRERGRPPRAPRRTIGHVVLSELRPQRAGHAPGSWWWYGNTFSPWAHRSGALSFRPGAGARAPIGRARDRFAWCEPSPRRFSTVCSVDGTEGPFAIGPGSGVQHSTPAFDADQVVVSRPPTVLWHCISTGTSPAASIERRHEGLAAPAS